MIEKGINPRDFGAKGNGESNDTQALQTSIDKCSERGGGIISLENGVFLTGTLFLKDNVTINIAKGAELKAVPISDEFKYVKHNYQSRMDTVPRRAVIYAENVKNITICGEGTFTGGGGMYDVFPSYKGEDPIRPFGFHFIDCENVVVKDITMRNSAYWMQRYLYCKNLRLENLKVWNHPIMEDKYKEKWDCVNSDGMDIDSCQDVFISNCMIDSGDDAICLKSEGNKPCKNIVITNCILATHASGIKFGTGAIGGFQNITVSNCVVRRSEATEMNHPLESWGGLAGIDLTCVDGGVMENITFNNISIDGVDTPIHIQVGNRLSKDVDDNGYTPQIINNDKNVDNIPVIKRASKVNGVILSNITASNVGKYPCSIHGYKGNKLQNIILKDIIIKCAIPGTEDDKNTKTDWAGNLYPGPHKAVDVFGMSIYEVDNLLMNNVIITPAEGEVREGIAFENVTNLKKENVIIMKK